MIFLKRLLHFLILFSLSILLIFLTTTVSANNYDLPSEPKLENGTELVESAKKYYDLGQFSYSVSYLEQAVTIFANQGEKLNQAITLSNLSSAYQQLGEWEQAEKVIASSLELLGYNSETEITNFSQQEQNIIASILDIYGHLSYEKGQTDLALDYWQKVENIYRQSKNQPGIISSQINQLLALQTLGMYQRLTPTVTKIQAELENLPSSLQVEALRSLGEVFATLGDLDKSEQILQQSLTIAQEIDSPSAETATLLSLGNTYWAKGNLERDRQNISTSYDRIPWQCINIPIPPPAKSYYQKAQKSYQEVIQLLPQSTNAIQAQLSLFNLFVESGESASAQQIWPTINLTNLPSSRTNIYATINLAHHLACLRQQNTASDSPSWQEIESILIQAIEGAKKISDQRALSYAYGNMGGFYEYLSQENPANTQLLITAQQLTEQALILAQPGNSPDIAYQWQWQLGRIYAHNGEQKRAISSYQDALATLKQVRTNLVAISADVQFSFRDNVEPVYRQLVKLLLSTEGDNKSEKTLRLAVNLIDDLQLAELENFLSCDLSSLATNSATTNELGKAAFIYPIILEDRLDVIYQLPGESLKYQANQVSRVEVEKTVNKLRDAIARRLPYVKEISQQVYQWLIKPLEVYLDSTTSVDTLVFVLDGYLRNIPMAVLYDNQNQEYLVEKDYALAVLPTSQLFNLNQSSTQLNVLAAGISEALEVEQKKFTPINAEAELAEVKKLVTTETLINSEFTLANLQQQLKQKDFSVIHLATHGNFSSDPQQTYLLSYEQLLRANDLNKLLGNNSQAQGNIMDLLILSACQTALGDNRATLGLAGLTVKAGAQSTLATLWQVSDKFTISLITEFYKQLSQGKTKAEALHQAQKSLIYTEINREKYSNDAFDWGAYILVGNWQ